MIPQVSRVFFDVATFSSNLTCCCAQLLNLSLVFIANECGSVSTGRVNSVFLTLVDMLMGHEEMGTEIMRERKYPGLFRNNLFQDSTFSFYSG